MSIRCDSRAPTPQTQKSTRTHFLLLLVRETHHHHHGWRANTHDTPRIFASFRRPPASATVATRSRRVPATATNARRVRVCVRQNRCRCPVGAVVNFPTPRRRGRCVRVGVHACVRCMREHLNSGARIPALCVSVCVCSVWCFCCCRVCVTRNTCELVRASVR